MDGYRSLGVATPVYMPVIKMNRYTKSACIMYLHRPVYKCIYVCFLENNCENGHAV